MKAFVAVLFAFFALNSVFAYDCVKGGRGCRGKNEGNACYTFFGNSGTCHFTNQAKAKCRCFGDGSSDSIPYPDYGNGGYSSGGYSGGGYSDGGYSSGGSSSGPIEYPHNSGPAERRSDGGGATAPDTRTPGATEMPHNSGPSPRRN